jgi:ferritin-like metal-binding protein YciE
MPKLTSLDDLFVHELRDIYDAEVQILVALPKMAEAAINPELKNAFEEHLKQTETHVKRLEKVFKLLGVPARGTTCDGMAGLLEEGRKVMKADAEPEVLDAALIGAAQKVEHYEIASYGCLCTYAEMLGYDQAHDLLGLTLDDEETTDQKLTELAEAVINPQAVEGESA